MRRRRPCSLPAIVVAACFMASITGLRGQSFQGGMRGTVRDSGGMVQFTVRFQV
jgi:hypothetical protein